MYRLASDDANRHAATDNLAIGCMSASMPKPVRRLDESGSR